MSREKYQSKEAVGRSEDLSLVVILVAYLATSPSFRTPFLRYQEVRDISNMIHIDLLPLLGGASSSPYIPMSISMLISCSYP